MRKTEELCQARRDHSQLRDKFCLNWLILSQGPLLPKKVLDKVEKCFFVRCSITATYLLWRWWDAQCFSIQNKIRVHLWLLGSWMLYFRFICWIVRLGRIHISLQHYFWILSPRYGHNFDILFYILLKPSIALWPFAIATLSAITPGDAIQFFFSCWPSINSSLFDRHNIEWTNFFEVDHILNNLMFWWNIVLCYKAMGMESLGDCDTASFSKITLSTDPPKSLF